MLTAAALRGAALLSVLMLFVRAADTEGAHLEQQVSLGGREVRKTICET